MSMINFFASGIRATFLPVNGVFLSCPQERVLEKLAKHHSTQALANSIEEGMKQQALSRQQRVVSNPNLPKGRKGAGKWDVCLQSR